MNQDLQNFGRNKLKQGLSKLPEANQLMFKRMYSHRNLDKDINSVVDDMDEDRISHAMTQVEATLNK